MKRTLNINIGNSIIHIEEDAYEALTIYLNDIKAHFARNADDFEIVKDIENRITEMFSEILTKQQKQAIGIEDVQQIIAQMGTVKDFESSEVEDEQFVPVDAPGIKRLYRDTDNGMVAGVCAGLGHYLDVEARWIRLIALFSVLAGGAGILAYLVTWIIVPRAQTRSEKMYMRGEAVNLQGFIRNFQEELENNHLFKQSGTFVSEFFSVIGHFLGGSGKIILKLTAGFIIFICSVMLISSLLAGAVFFGVFDATTNEIFPLSMVNDSYVPWLLVSCFVLLAIPLLALILFSFRVAFNSRPVQRNVSFGLLIIWLFAIGSTAYMIAKTCTEFKEHTEITQVNPLKAYGTYTLELDNSRTFSRQDSITYQISSTHKDRVILDDDDRPFQEPDNVNIRIEKSLDEKYAVVQTLGANGKTFGNALSNAQAIKYNFLQQDSLLRFSSKPQLGPKTKWRNQQVTITIKMPVGTILILSKKLDHYLANYRSWDCEQVDEKEDEQFVEWIMTENGLKCKYEKSGKDQEEN